MIPKKIPLHLILTLQFVLQVLGIVGLVGYFSYRSGQSVVENLAHQLMNTTAEKTYSQLDDFLGDAPLILATYGDLIERDKLDIDDFAEFEALFFQTLQLYPGLTAINFYNSQSQSIGVARDTHGVISSPNTMLALEKQGVGLGKAQFYRLSDQGDRLDLVFEVPQWNPVALSWYQIAIKKDQPQWTAIVPLIVTPVPAIMAVQPIQKEGKVEGVLNITLLLHDINQFLSELNLSPPRTGVYCRENRGIGRYFYPGNCCTDYP